MNFADARTRFAVAIPCALILTAAVVLALRMTPPAPAPENVTATVVLEKPPPTPAPTPIPPTPRPTVPPTPRPIAHVTLAPVPQRAAPHRVRPSGGGHAAPTSRPHPAPQKVVVAGSGGGSGPGTGEGAGPGAGGGTGSGTGGSGTGAVNADAPCGTVDLIPYRAPDHSGTITYEHVMATVTFPDGHTQSADFPYRWAYGDPSLDPWSPQNLPNNDFVTRVQLPPPGADVGRYDDVIRYILAHTRSDGTTVLQECPQQR